MAGQARPHHGRRQRPLDRLGHRRRLRGAGRGARLHLPGRGAGAAGCARSPTSLGSDLVVPCDVADEASIDAAFAALGERWDRLDFLVHAIGFADKHVSARAAISTRRATPSCRRWTSPAYSFTAVCQRAVPLMKQGGSLLTLTYLGAERVMPHYNVMGVAKAALEAWVRYLAADLGGDGIRVNAICAGPIKTLAATGIGDFRYILSWNQLNSPLQRNVTIEDVGGAGALSAVRSRRPASPARCITSIAATTSSA